jgi:hypothetical protein
MSNRVVVQFFYCDDGGDECCGTADRSLRNDMGLEIAQGRETSR